MVVEEGRGREAALEARCTELAEQLEGVVREYERRLALEESSQALALERLRTELTGSAEQLAELREQVTPNPEPLTPTLTPSPT